MKGHHAIIKNQLHMPLPQQQRGNRHQQVNQSLLYITAAANMAQQVDQDHQRKEDAAVFDRHKKNGVRYRPPSLFVQGIPVINTEQHTAQCGHRKQRIHQQIRKAGIARQKKHAANHSQ